MNAVRAWWLGRPARDRRIASGIALLVLALLLAAAGLQAERTRTRLSAELPRLRASLVSLERDAAEARRLRAMPAATPATAGAPLAALATNGGGLAGAQVQVLDDRRVRVNGGDVSFAALLEWLRNAQATHAMRVEAARIEALPAAGRVRAELTLIRG